MSSIAPKSSNPWGRKMTESEYAIVEIPSNQLVNDNYKLANEWENNMEGKETTKSYNRERHMEKVPSALLKTEKGRRNREYYEPAVVSLGPYHHNRIGLAEAETYKLITLEEYCFNAGESIGLLHDKVFEVVHDARKCYIDGSTDVYNDHEFSQMMLRDGCFVLFFIECLCYRHVKLLLTNEYLGTLEFLNIMRDIFLLENQIPFIVLEVLLNLRFPHDKGEEVLNIFFNYLNHGVVTKRTDKKVLKYTQRPLHLLELYRSYFISLEASLSGDRSTSSAANRNYVKESRWFPSVTGLKSKWIFLREATGEADMKFDLHYWHGEFKIVNRAIAAYTKAIFLNMVAYEMCPHNPNDFRISTYLRVMKALIIQDADVKELRDQNILFHGLGLDEEVVRMFKEIEVPTVNLRLYSQIREEIKKLHSRRYKAWVRELTTVYFGSPWKTLGLLVAVVVLVTSCVQTYFAINPRGSK